jgi:endonuclease III-like uncharacterized protein
MDMVAINVVLRRIIAQQTQVKKVGRAWQKFERRKVSLVQSGGIGPDPADSILLQHADKLWAVPSRVPKFNGKPEIARQLDQKSA